MREETWTGCCYGAGGDPGIDLPAAASARQPAATAKPPPHCSRHAPSMELRGHRVHLIRPRCEPRSGRLLRTKFRRDTKELGCGPAAWALLGSNFVHWSEIGRPRLRSSAAMLHLHDPSLDRRTSCWARCSPLGGRDCAAQFRPCARITPGPATCAIRRRSSPANPMRAALCSSCDFPSQRTARLINYC